METTESTAKPQTTLVLKREKRRTAADNKITDIPNQKPNFHYRWVNDERNHLQQALDRGYFFIDNGGAEIKSLEKLGTRLRDVAGEAKNGQPLFRYAMATLNKHFEEDQLIKQSTVNKREGVIKAGQTDRQPEDGRDGNDTSDRIKFATKTN